MQREGAVHRKDGRHYFIPQNTAPARGSAEVAFFFDTIIDERNSYLTGTDIYFDNGCDANGYLGQFDPYDPSVNPYDPRN